MSSEPAGSDVTSSSQSLRMTFTDPGVSGIGRVTTTPSIGGVRCDNGATARSGCIHTTVVPTFALNGAANPSSPQHACYLPENFADRLARGRHDLALS